MGCHRSARTSRKVRRCRHLYLLCRLDHRYRGRISRDRLHRRFRRHQGCRRYRRLGQLRHLVRRCRGPYGNLLRLVQRRSSCRCRRCRCRNRCYRVLHHCRDRRYPS